MTVLRPWPRIGQDATTARRRHRHSTSRPPHSTPARHAPCLLLPAAARVAPGSAVPRLNRHHRQPSTWTAAGQLDVHPQPPSPAARSVTPLASGIHARARAAPSLGRRPPPLDLTRAAAARPPPPACCCSASRSTSCCCSLRCDPRSCCCSCCSVAAPRSPCCCSSCCCFAVSTRDADGDRLALSLDDDEGSVAARSTPTKQRRRLLPDAAASWIHARLVPEPVSRSLAISVLPARIRPQRRSPDAPPWPRCRAPALRDRRSQRRGSRPEERPAPARLAFASLPSVAKRTPAAAPQSLPPPPVPQARFRALLHSRLRSLLRRRLPA